MLRAVAVLLALLVFPAVAAAEPRSGTLTDPAGDSASTGADLTGVDVTYDTGGDVTAKVRLAAALSDPDALVVVTVGTGTAGDCRLGFVLGGNATEAAWSTGSSSGDGTAGADGATLTLSASDIRLGDDYTCFKAQIVRQSDTSTTLDDAGGATLAGAPEPQPTATASPEPTATPDAPVIQGTKPKATPLERYDAAIAACAKKPKKARAACRRTAKKKNKSGAELAAKRGRNPLIGRIYLQFQPDVAGICGGGCVEYLGFPTDTKVSTELPEDGPALDRCAKKCSRYRYKRRRLTIGGKAFSLSKDGRKLTEKGEASYFRVNIPRPGLRINVALESISSFGIPGVSQTFSSSELSLDKDGRFVLSSAVSSFNNQGSDFENTFTALPPNRRGTYAFEPGGTLALHFASGDVRRDSATVAFGGDGRLGDPVKDGLFLDGTFFHIPD